MPKYESRSQGAAVRKAARQTPIDDAPKNRGVPNKRNTKKWCKGKIGVEHKVGVGAYADLKSWRGISFDPARNIFRGWLIRYCTECGKELETYMPPLSWDTKPRVVPDWAEAFFVEHPDERPVRPQGVRTG